MIKKGFIFISLFCSFFCLFCLSGCENRKGIILFNHLPITKKNLVKNDVEFSVGERIYYIFVAKKELEDKYITIKLKKQDDNAKVFDTQFIYSNTYRLRKDEAYYFTDYIVLHESGYYLMQVYSKDDRNGRPLASADFHVRDAAPSLYY